MRRKLMAWIMSIMMIATMMPTMAFAEGESGGTTVSPASYENHQEKSRRDIHP